MILASAQRATASVINTLLPYNGVVENGFLQCNFRDTEETVSQPTTNNLKTTKDLETVKDNRAPRPTSIGRVTGFPRHFSGSALAGGSNASTPESSLDFDSLPESLTTPSDGVLEIDTKNLVNVFFRSYSGLSHPRCSQPKALASIDRVVKSLVTKHEIAYKGMIKRLNFDEMGDDMSFISGVAREIFRDGINWGRIASLLAFGAVLCSHLKTRGQENCIDQVGSLISSYLISDQLDWFINNKEWDGFVQFFHEVEPEFGVKGALVALAGMAGIGAGLAFLIR